MPKPKEKKRYSLVQCRIEACQKIDELAEKENLNKKDAMTLLAQQTGLSYNTLNWWYYNDPESSKSNTESHVRQTVDNSNKIKSKVAKKALNTLVKAVDDQRSAGQRETLKSTAQEQLNEAGSVIVAEEFYEKFRDATSKVDQLIRANSELEDPVNPEKLYVEILRLARNAGWEEPEPKLVKCCSNRTCDNFMSKEDREKAIAAVRKKAKKR